MLFRLTKNFDLNIKLQVPFTVLAIVELVHRPYINFVGRLYERILQQGQLIQNDAS